MAKSDTQRAAHAFLLDRLLSGRSFTLQEFREATGWDKPGLSILAYASNTGAS